MTTSEENLQNHRLMSIEVTLKEVVKNQQHQQTQTAVMQSILERNNRDHEEVITLKEKVAKLEKVIYTCAALAVASLLGVIGDAILTIVRTGS